MLIGVAADDVKFRAQLVALLAASGHRAAELALNLGGVAALRAAKPHRALDRVQSEILLGGEKK